MVFGTTYGGPMAQDWTELKSWMASSAIGTPSMAVADRQHGPIIDYRPAVAGAATP